MGWTLSEMIRCDFDYGKKGEGVCPGSMFGKKGEGVCPVSIFG